MQALEYWFSFGFKLAIRHCQLGVMSYWQIAGMLKGAANRQKWSRAFYLFCPISFCSWPWYTKLLIKTEAVSLHLHQCFTALSREDDKSSKCEMVFLWGCSHFVNWNSKTVLSYREPHRVCNTHCFKIFWFFSIWHLFIENHCSLNSSAFFMCIFYVCNAGLPHT